MDLYKLLANLVENPLVPRFYRELRDHYFRIGKDNEAAAFDLLIEHKFGKKDDPPDNSSPDTEQRGNDISMPGVDSSLTS